MSNFTFAGKHCLNDMGCLFVKDSEPAVPAVKGHVYEISGMSGTLRYNTGSTVLKETILSGTLYFVKDSLDGRMTEAEITQRRHDVAAWLVNAERASMVMDSDITREYQAEVLAEAALARKDWQNGYLKVKFVVQPVSESVDPTLVETSVTTVAGTKNAIDLSALIPNGIGTETPLDITLKLMSGSKITDLAIGYNVNGEERVFILNQNEFSMDTGSTVVLHSESGEVILNGENGIKHIGGGDFPVLTPRGESSMSITVNGAATISVTASCNVRWI